MKLKMVDGSERVVQRGALHATLCDTCSSTKLNGTCREFNGRFLRATTPDSRYIRLQACIEAEARAKKGQPAQ